MAKRAKCSECDEPAQKREPRNAGVIAMSTGKRPEWSHTDGEPLCPVMGPNGYEPAQPDKG